MSGGSVAIENTTISYNYGAEGGGINIYGGKVRLTNSALLWNYAYRPNSASGGGGAIATFGPSLVEATNCTLAGNSTAWDGGGIANGGTMTITNSTLAYNSSEVGSGQIDNGGTVLLRNSILADSLAGWNCWGNALIDGGGNLRWPETDTSCVGDYGDPNLKTLALNNGQTLNMAIDITSAAFQHATANCPATDQRGLPRNRQPGTCDSGAYELQDALWFLPLISR